MGVEAIAVREFKSTMNVTKFGAKRCSARHCRIHVQPDIVRAADGSELRQGVDGVRRGCSHGRADETGYESDLLIIGNLPLEKIRTHSKVRVHVDQPQIAQSNADNLNCFFYGGMCLGGSVCDQLSIASTVISGKIRGTLTSSQQGA